MNDLEAKVRKSPSWFPYQKRLDREKNEDFFKDCTDAGITILWWNQSTGTSIRTTRKEKITNYNLYNDIMDRTEIERVTNPFRIQDAEFPVNYKNYPLLNKNIEVLLGEERKRMFNPVVTVVNDDIINEKQNFINEEFNKFVINRLMSDNVDEKQTEKELADFNKWRLGYRDQRERMVQSILDWGFKTKYFKQTFSKGFEDLLIGGEEIYVADIYGGEPILRRADPRNIYTIRSGDSPYVEDADVIVEDMYLPIGEVIDRYHEDLTPKQITDIEGHFSTGRGNMMNALTNQPLNFGETALFNNGYVDGDVNDILSINRNQVAAFGGYYDYEGNVRVTRVLWKGMRKIGVLTYYDKDGNELKKFVPEQYKADKNNGEDVKWEWVSEWYEGTKIGYDIYVRGQVLPFQMRHRDNPSICKPGIVGTAMNVGGGRSKSMVGIAKDWQYLYNVFMYRLEHFFIKSVGKVGVLPLHLLPNDWPMDKVMYYATVLGWIPFDAFNESNRGASTGKLAGGMSQVPTHIDMSFNQEIQQTTLMLGFIENQMDQLMGVSAQRRGSVDNRETATGIQMATNNSSSATERWFDIHDYTKVRALMAFVDVCKIAWRGKSFTKQYVLDDGSLGVLDFDWNNFAETESSIALTTATSDMQMFNALRQNIDRLLQSGTPLSIINDLYTTESPNVLKRKIAAWEEQQNQQKQQELQQTQELQTQQLQHQEQLEAQRLQLEYDKLDRADVNAELDRQNAIEKATISAMGFDTNKDQDGDGTPDILEVNKLALEHSKHSYDVAFKEKTLKAQQELDNKKLSVEQEKMKNDMKLQKLKSSTDLAKARISAKKRPTK